MRLILVMLSIFAGFRNPGKNFNRVELKRDSRRTYAAIGKITKNGGYRKDLSKVSVVFFFELFVRLFFTLLLKVSMFL